MEMNLFDDEGWLERTWPPERPGYRWRRKRVAGEHLGAGLIELPPGESTFPYHYELAPGDCVLFASGPAGAHKLTNRSGSPVRILLVSNFSLPRAAVQVDSGKMMVRWGPGRDERRWFFVGDEADYWDGEADV
jgi:hypothetical protein